VDPIACPFPPYEYGRCGCGGFFETRFVEVRMTVNDEQVVLQEIPQGACPDCGSRVYKAEVLELIETIMAGELPRAAAATTSG